LNELPEPWRRRGPIALVLAFWTVQYSILTASRMLMETPDDPSFLLPRLCVTAVGISISLVIVEALRRLIGRPLSTRLMAALGFAVAACMIHSAVNFFIFQLFMPAKNMANFTFASWFMAVLSWFWNYAALSGLLLALTYALELNTLERVTHTAQIRALRYQLNPHFMFNTLNSIASLIARGDNRIAETMVENLGDFLRASLSLDPQDDIPLDREIHLQSLYLDIETLRFGERLKVEIDVPEDTRSALVPSLITQPLAENVVRHAVANSTRPIHFTIEARREGDRLRLTARNSGPDGVPRAMPGTGIGLGNVAARLNARYGCDASYKAERREDGGFAVILTMPFIEARQE
jgi:two-component system LytT family sensor kinase